MKKIIRLTESELHGIVRRTVARVIREQAADMQLLNLIAWSIDLRGVIYAKPGYNDIEVELGDGTTAYIEYAVNSSPYRKKGMASHDRDVPDDPDEIVDDVEIEVVSIHTDDGNEIYDNGIVAAALNSCVEVDYVYDDIPDEDDYFYNED